MRIGNTEFANTYTANMDPANTDLENTYAANRDPACNCVDETSRIFNTASENEKIIETQVTPDSVTVLVKSHADIGHSEPVTNLGREAMAKSGAGILLTLVVVVTCNQHL